MKPNTSLFSLKSLFQLPPVGLFLCWNWNSRKDSEKWIEINFWNAFCTLTFSTIFKYFVHYKRLKIISSLAKFTKGLWLFMELRGSHVEISNAFKMYFPILLLLTFSFKHYFIVPKNRHEKFQALLTTYYLGTWP